MFSESRKKKVLCNYYFKLFGDEIYNMNKNQYIDFHMYTEAKSSCVLAEEIKVRKMNRSSKTKNSKDNSSGAANTGNNNK